MRRTLLVLLLLLASGAKAQLSLDACDSVQLQAMVHLPGYYTNHQPDLVWQTIFDWQKACTTDETMCATLAFFDLLSGRFEQQVPPADLLPCLRDWAEAQALPHPTYAKAWQSYRAFIRTEAEAIDTTGLSPDEAFVRAALAEAASLKGLSLLYPGAQLSADYRHWRDSIDRLPRLGAGVYLGAYLPLGFNKLFGQHPVLGFYGYVQGGRHWVGLALDFKLGKARESYQVLDGGQLVDTRGFAATAIELAYAQRITRPARHGLWAKLGMGGDFITALEPEDTNNDGEYEYDGHYLRSLLLSLGLEHHYLHRGSVDVYTGLHYYSTRHTNPGGSNVSGNYVVLRLSIGRSLGL